MLSRPWHFEKVMGQEIDIKLFAPIDGSKEISGILKAYSDGEITIESNDKEIIIHILEKI